MPESKFNKQTDSEEKVKLDSALIYAAWKDGAAYTGAPAGFVVGTVFVGNGAKIEIAGKSEGGKSLGKIKDTIDSNRYAGEFEIPDDTDPGDEIYFTVKISKNGIDEESNRIPVFQGPLITNMQWSEQEARRGDVLKLTADVEKVANGTEVLVTIYEYDEDGAHDKIAEIPAEIKDFKLEVEWEYEYHEDTDEIPTTAEMGRYGGSYNPPEYFFTVKCGGFEAGKERESGLLTFKDYIDIVLRDAAGNPAADARYIVHLPDGSQREGQLDAGGRAREEGIAPGHIEVEFPDLRQVDPLSGEEE